MALPTPTEFWTLNDTLVGAVAGKTPIPTDGVDRYVDGRVDKAWDCAASASRAPKLLSPGIDVGTAFSCSVWIKMNRGSGDFVATYINLYNASNSIQFYIELVKFFFTTELHAYWPSSMIMWNPPPGFMVDWHHVCITHTGTLATLWVDGVKCGELSEVISSSVNPTVLILGSQSDSSNNPTDGYTADVLDSVGWWNVALNESHIAELYNAGAGWEFEDESSSLSSSVSSGSSESSKSSSSLSPSSGSSQSSSSTSSSQSSGTIDLPRSCTITTSSTFSLTAVVEKPT